jgi:hypothetical protein
MALRVNVPAKLVCGNNLVYAIRNQAVPQIGGKLCMSSRKGGWFVIGTAVAWLKAGRGLGLP